MTYEVLLRSAIRLLAIRAHSTKEMVEKLSRKTDNQSLIDRVIDYLQQKKYLEDDAFADSLYVSLKNKLKGPSLIRFELQKKGISPEKIHSLLSADTDPRDSIRRFLEQKRSWASLPKLKLRQKAATALMRRGFSLTDILAVIDEKAKTQ